MALMAMFAILALPSAAQAQTLLGTKSNGGVTCNKYSAQTSWPTYYWNCDDTVNGGTTSKADARNVTNGAATLPSHLRVSPVTDYEHYLFKNASDFAAFTGTTAPPANSHGDYAPGVLIGGVLTAPIAAVFKNVTQDGIPITVTTTQFRVHMAQVMGRIVYSKLIFPTNATVDRHFKAAINYDAAYVDENPPKGPSVVWPTIYGDHPGESSWQILTNVYGSSVEEVFGYQFGRLASVGNTVAPLNGALDDMPNTYGIVQYYVWNATPPTSTDRYYAESVFDGGVYTLCVIQDWTSGSTLWPNKHFNCVHPYDPSTPEKTFLDALRRTSGTYHIRSDWRSTLAGANLKLYIMRDCHDWDSFFGVSECGNGQYGLSNKSSGRTAVFRNVLTNSGPFDTSGEFYENSINHEVGHQLNFLLSYPMNNGGLETAMKSDRTAFDGMLCADAIDQWQPGLCAAHPTLTNWEIARDVKTMELMEDLPAPPNDHPSDIAKDEAFARAFAYLLPGLADPFFEGVESLMTDELDWMVDAYNTGTFN
jgi:hypothetical protein